MTTRNAAEKRRAPRFQVSLAHKLRLVDGGYSVFAQEFDEFCNAALFIGAKVILNVPPEIVFSEIQIVLGPGLDNIVQSIDAKIFGFMQAATQIGILNSSS